MDGTKVGSIYWEADLDNKKVVKGISETSDAIKGLDSKANNATLSVSGLVKGLVVGAGILSAVKTAFDFGAKGVQMAGDLETAKQGFTTLLGSAEEAAAAIAMIKKDAAATPFELPGLINANQLLTQVTKDAQRSEEVLLNVGKALAASGKGQNELNSIIANLQQIGNTGKITEMDIRQFGMSGVNILELLADYYGTTKDEAADMVKNSSDGFRDLEGAFAKAGGAGGKFANSFKEQSGTFNQSISNLKDSFGIALSDIAVKTGLFDLVKVAIKETTETIQFVAPIIIGTINVISSSVMALGAVLSTIGRLVVGFFDALGHLAVFDFQGMFKSITDSANGIKSDFKGTTESIKKLFADSNTGMVASNKKKNEDINASNKKLSAEQEKDIAKENEAFKRSTEQKLKSFKQSMADMIWAHQDKVESLNGDISDENKSFEEKMRERVKDFAQSMAEMVTSHSKKVSDIKKQLEREKLDTQKANDALLLDAKDEKTQETNDHEKKVDDLQKLIDREVLFGKNGSKSKIQSLKDQIEEENGLYDAKIADIDKKTDKEVLKNNEALDQKLLDLNDELVQENASFDMQKAKLEQDDIDTTNKMKLEHENRIADYQKTLDQETAILKLHQTDVDAIKGKARQDDITKLQQQFAEETRLANEDHARKLTDIASKGNQLGNALANNYNIGQSQQAPAIRQAFNSMTMDPLKDLSGKSGEAGKNVIGSFLNGIVDKVRNMGASTAEWFKKIIGDSFFNLPRFASGVRGFGGGKALVGELGPEIVDLPAGANVYSNKDSKKMMGGGQQNVTINIDKVRDYQDVQQISRELAFKFSMNPA